MITVAQKQQPGLVVSYDIRPGNREGLFWFWRFINLTFTYLLRDLPTYLQPRDPHGAKLALLSKQVSKFIENCSNPHTE